MEKFFDKFESFLDKQMASLEDKPVSTTLKFMFLYWVIRKGYNLVKDDFNDSKKA